ncbi:hypothetical protein FACS189451_03950 [Bacteroidia bacterium]|nr:hypothetical protein FACS189446_1750 [Bacteroidia bacterium]GHT61590.1 hypothetical protein FACS189451_03950 [Bacteroidia bacterium]
METIQVKPINKQFVADNAILLILLFISILGTGYDQKFIKIGFVVASGLFAIIILLKWWEIKSICWTITPEQLIYERGVFMKQKDFIELYRVNDFKEMQTFIQQFIGSKTVIIHSSDRSHPVLKIFGINNKSDITDIIRERVEINKQKKGVYEIANR